MPFILYGPHAQVFRKQRYHCELQVLYIEAIVDPRFFRRANAVVARNEIVHEVLDAPWRRYHSIFIRASGKSTRAVNIPRASAGRLPRFQRPWWRDLELSQRLSTLLDTRSIRRTGTRWQFTILQQKLRR